MANVFANFFENITDDRLTNIAAADADASLVIQLDICNTHTSEISVNVIINNSTSDYYFIKNVPIPVGSTLQVISGQKIVLVNGDTLQVQLTDSGYKCDVICGVLTAINA